MGTSLNLFTVFFSVIVTGAHYRLSTTFSNILNRMPPGLSGHGTSYAARCSTRSYHDSALKQLQWIHILCIKKYS